MVMLEGKHQQGSDHQVTLVALCGQWLLRGGGDKVVLGQDT